MENFPRSHQDLLADETKAFGYLATIMADGTPQLTPVWFNVDGEYILLNSAKGRIKDQNMRARPRIALVIHDQKNPLRYVQVRGKIVDIVSEGARDHINDLSLKYTGNPTFTLNDPEQVRLIYKLFPERIQVSG
jgi:PPOX class probable F420-dependent enzyme